MAYEVRSGVPKPSVKKKLTGVAEEKYPTSKLEVNEHFIVPKTEMLEGDTPAKFRNRINNAVRSYRLRVNKARALDPDYNPDTFVPQEYSVITLGAPTEPDQNWEAGDVGVWRDA